MKQQGQLLLNSQQNSRLLQFPNSMIIHQLDFKRRRAFAFGSLVPPPSRHPSSYFWNITIKFGKWLPPGNSSILLEKSSNFKNTGKILFLIQKL
jgi:hypothetical protein